MDPFEPDIVDELWSAELDGEFDATARDLGLAPEAARARLDATAGAQARRAALERAREALREPVAPLAAARREEMLAVAAGGRAGIDELAHRRERRGRSTGRLAGLAVAAAAVLLVVGLAVSITSTGSDNGNDSNASGAGAASDSAATTAQDGAQREATDGLAASPEAPSASAPVYEFGAVADEDILRTRVAQALGLQEPPFDRQAEAGDTDTSATAREQGVSEACLALQADNFEVAATPTLRGRVEYQGTAAEVLVFAQGEDSLVLTVATDECRLLVSLFVHPEP